MGLREGGWTALEEAELLLRGGRGAANSTPHPFFKPWWYASESTIESTAAARTAAA